VSPIFLVVNWLLNTFNQVFAKNSWKSLRYINDCFYVKGTTDGMIHLYTSESYN